MTPLAKHIRRKPNVLVQHDHREKVKAEMGEEAYNALEAKQMQGVWWCRKETATLEDMAHAKALAAVRNHFARAKKKARKVAAVQEAGEGGVVPQAVRPEPQPEEEAKPEPDGE